MLLVDEGVVGWLMILHYVINAIFVKHFHNA